MNIIGMRNSASFGAEPDIKDWSDRVAVNAARVPPERATEPAIAEAVARMRAATAPAVARLDDTQRLTSKSGDRARARPVVGTKKRWGPGLRPFLPAATAQEETRRVDPRRAGLAERGPAAGADETFVGTWHLPGGERHGG